MRFCFFLISSNCFWFSLPSASQLSLRRSPLISQKRNLKEHNHQSALFPPCLSYSFSPVWLLAQVQTQAKAELTFLTLLVIPFLSCWEHLFSAAHNSNQRPKDLLAGLRFWKCLNLTGCFCIHSQSFCLSQTALWVKPVSPCLHQHFPPANTTFSYTFRGFLEGTGPALAWKANHRLWKASLVPKFELFLSNSFHCLLENVCLYAMRIGPCSNHTTCA